MWPLIQLGIGSPQTTIYWILFVALMFWISVATAAETLDGQGFGVVFLGIFTLVTILFTNAVPTLWVWIPILVIYPVIGVPWAYFKWVTFIKKSKLEAENVAALHNRTLQSWMSMGELAKPKFSANSDQITFWILLWPWSIVGYALTIPRKWFKEWIKSLVSKFESVIDEIWDK